MTAPRGASWPRWAFPVAFLLWGCGEGRPPEISLPGVVVAVRSYTKERLLRSGNLNLVQSLDLGDFDHDGESELLVTGTNGACLLDGDPGGEKCFVRDFGLLSRVQLVDLEGDHRFEYLVSSPGEPAVAVVDLEGKVRWQSDEVSHPSAHALAVDLDGDGLQEVILDSPSRQVVFDAGGRRVDLRSDVEHVWRIVDLDGDGRPDQIRQAARDGVRTVAVVLASGVTTSKPLSGGRLLQTVRLPGGEGAGIAVETDPAVEIWDARLNVVARVEPPLWDILFVERVAMVSVPAGEWGGGGAALVTLQGGASDWHRTVLCVQALSGEILYEEVLGDDARGLLVPDEGAESGTIFVRGAERGVPVQAGAMSADVMSRGRGQDGAWRPQDRHHEPLGHPATLPASPVAGNRRSSGEHAGSAAVPARTAVSRTSLVDATFLERSPEPDRVRRPST